jgi:hypothetical protein
MKITFNNLETRNRHFYIICKSDRVVVKTNDFELSMGATTQCHRAQEENREESSHIVTSTSLSLYAATGQQWVKSAQDASADAL